MSFILLDALIRSSTISVCEDCLVSNRNKSMSANGEAQVDSWEEVESLPIDRLRLEPPAPRQQQDSAYEQGYTTCQLRLFRPGPLSLANTAHCFWPCRQAPETNTRSIPGEAAASSPPGVPGVDPAVYDALCNSRSRLQGNEATHTLDHPCSKRSPLALQTL